MARGGEEELHRLVQRFRQVFVLACKPKFLPANWAVDAVDTRQFGEYSVYAQEAAAAAGAAEGGSGAAAEAEADCGGGGGSVGRENGVGAAGAEAAAGGVAVLKKFGRECSAAGGNVGVEGQSAPDVSDGLSIFGH